MLASHTEDAIRWWSSKIKMKKILVCLCICLLKLDCNPQLLHLISIDHYQVKSLKNENGHNLLIKELTKVICQRISNHLLNVWTIFFFHNCCTCWLPSTILLSSCSLKWSRWEGFGRFAAFSTLFLANFRPGYVFKKSGNEKSWPASEAQRLKGRIAQNFSATFFDQMGSQCGSVQLTDSPHRPLQVSSLLFHPPQNCVQYKDNFFIYF